MTVRRVVGGAVVALVAAAACVACVAREPQPVEASPSIVAEPEPTIVNEFDTSADTSEALDVWNIQTGGGGWGNNELQQYSWDAVHVNGGSLMITANIPPDGGTPTSGRMTTEGKWSFLYGTLESRIELPSEKGLLPAFWLMGDSLSTEGWPRSGEIDVVESPSDGGTAVSSVHGATTSGREWKKAVTVPISPGFHIYSVEKQPGVVTIRIDGVVTAIFSKEQFAGTDIVWPFDQPTHVLLSLAVGGNWPGDPDATTPTTSRMYVDWFHFTPSS